MKIWHWILIALGILVLPLLINSLVVRPAFFRIAGDEATWLSFWVTYISAIASFAMVIITWWTMKLSKQQNNAILKQNEEQLNEIKRQWEEQNKPKVIPYLLKCDGQGFLILRNYSSVFINEVTIKLELIGEAKLDWLDRLLPKLEKSRLNFEPFGSKSLLINYHCWAESEYNGVLKVSILIEGNKHDDCKLDLSEWNVVEYTESEKTIKALDGIKDQLKAGIRMK